MSAYSISAVEANKVLEADEKALLVDVRTPAEYRAVHALGAKNLPLDTLNPAACATFASANSDSRILVICKSGQRARIAVDRFMSAGLTNVIVINGGTDSWINAGLSVARGKAAVDLERQVRIVAGSLVAAGILLSFFVHPYFVYLALFVGCGLVFAGVTNTCAMGMLLSKMPWNRA